MVQQMLAQQQQIQQQFAAPRVVELPQLPPPAAPTSSERGDAASNIERNLTESVRKSLGDFNREAEKTCTALINEVSSTIKNVSAEANQSLSRVSQEAREAMSNFLKQVADSKREAIDQWQATLPRTLL